MAHSFETVRLDPQPKGLITKWSLTRLAAMTHSYDTLFEASKLGAAARSERGESEQRRASPVAASAMTVQDPPLALVRPGTLVEAGELVGAAGTAPSLAAQVASKSGFALVEEFEVTR